MFFISGSLQAFSYEPVVINTTSKGTSLTISADSSRILNINTVSSSSSTDRGRQHGPWIPSWKLSPESPPLFMSDILWLGTTTVFTVYGQHHGTTSTSYQKGNQSKCQHPNSDFMLQIGPRGGAKALT